ncbi:MAG: gfo/Idh/MocA family oxidoreductase [Candidatus Omnitrophota bacterium]|nr:MAG: gfo/Idh/MocA family oxidoreductase [Candidatus Omnitrophota bacterium]
MGKNEKENRRSFLKKTAPAAAMTIVSRHVLGGENFTPPSEKVNIAYIGCGTQGIRQLLSALPNPDVHIAAVCDPNEESTDYIGWSKNEIRDKVRKFLKKSSWDEGVEGCRCGRKVGREITEAYYAMSQKSERYQGCAAYADFRELLENEADIDALYIMTPDHLHTAIALTAMKKGKHAITHKSLSNVYHEIQLAAEMAEKTGLATHMFCSAGNYSTSTLCEWIWSGAIGPVREVHNWSSRPFWPQGMTAFPPEQVAIPKGLDWKLWLGPVPDRLYHPSFTHAVFRGWYDFGAGALGDMGHYSFYQIFKILKLSSPLSVEASRSQYWEIVDSLWKKQENRISYPRASMIHWEFPAREDMPPVSLFWYDGGLRPLIPQELQTDGKPMPEEGLLFVGDKGKILAGFSGENPRIIPEANMNAFQQPPETLPRPIGELEQWLRACKGGPESDASFPNIFPLAETIALGNIALRVDQKLQWDGEKKVFTNNADAMTFTRRAYRPGWEL